MGLFASKIGYPIVDLFTLYKNIERGGFFTRDGVEVKGQWPGGNFFSADGITISAFGQSVITNEVIKIINSFYKSDIPYISTREFLK